MGVARAGHGRSVAVDVDPNTQKFFFQKFPILIREVTPGSPSPRKPHINTGSGSENPSKSHLPLWGVFGVRVAEIPAPQLQIDGACAVGMLCLDTEIHDCH